MAEEVKEIFTKLPESSFSRERLEKAVEPAKRHDRFRKSNYGKYLVLLCGDHKGKEINLEYLEQLKRNLRVGHGINCWLGNDYIREAGKVRERDIQKAYLRDADIIAFIDGNSAGTLDESGDIRKMPELKRKTIAFFRYTDFAELVSIPDRQGHISEFKYPMPYRELDELEAKITFGLKHVILYYLNKDICTGNKEAERAGQ